MKDDNQHKLPANILAALERIEMLKLKGEHKQSISEAEQLLCRDPDCVEALEELADNYVSLDNFEKAERACNRALGLNQKSYTAHYILGFIASHHQKWTTAVDWLKQANNIFPNNPEILRCLGWALFNQGKRTQGIVILERSLNIDSLNSLTLCDLGICYLQVKNFEKATELLKKAMELDPDNPRIQECYKAAKGFSDRFLSETSRMRRRIV